MYDINYINLMSTTIDPKLNSAFVPYFLLRNDNQLTKIILIMYFFLGTMKSNKIDENNVNPIKNELKRIIKYGIGPLNVDKSVNLTTIFDEYHYIISFLNSPHDDCNTSEYQWWYNKYNKGNTNLTKIKLMKKKIRKKIKKMYWCSNVTCNNSVIGQFICDACNTYRYCSKKCQKKHWKMYHRWQCHKLHEISQIVAGDRVYTAEEDDADSKVHWMRLAPIPHILFILYPCIVEWSQWTTIKHVDIYLILYFILYCTCFLFYFRKTSVFV